MGVAVEGGFRKAFGLDFAGGDDALADGDGGFAGEALVGHFVLLEARDFDVDVDAVQHCLICAVRSSCSCANVTIGYLRAWLPAIGSLPSKSHRKS